MLNVINEFGQIRTEKLRLGAQISAGTPLTSGCTNVHHRAELRSIHASSRNFEIAFDYRTRCHSFSYVNRAYPKDFACEFGQLQGDGATRHTVTHNIFGCLIANLQPLIHWQRRRLPPLLGFSIAECDVERATPPTRGDSSLSRSWDGGDRRNVSYLGVSNSDVVEYDIKGRVNRCS